MKNISKIKAGSVIDAGTAPSHGFTQTMVYLNSVESLLVDVLLAIVVQ